MSSPAVLVDQVSKSFRRGAGHDTLRDLLPSFARRVLSPGSRPPGRSEEFWALRDVSFEVGRGQAFAVIGNNGSGKSTLLRLLSKIMKPNAGSIACNGRLTALIEVGAGFHPDLTGRDNIFLNGAILGMSKREIAGKFDEIVEFSGIPDFIDTPVKRYSSGMKARLGFSVAAHVDPDILLVDEVLSVGDWAFQQKCMSRMESIMGGGTTVVFVSHNLRAVSAFCQQGILLERGGVVEAGPAAEIVMKYLHRFNQSNADHGEGPVAIANAVLTGVDGASSVLDAGSPFRVEALLSARLPTDRLALAIFITDDNGYQIFNTSTERLGLDPMSMMAGESRRVIFDLTAHLTGGQYRVGLVLKRYQPETNYDLRFPAFTFYVKSAKDVRGGAQLYPAASIEHP